MAKTIKFSPAFSEGETVYHVSDDGEGTVFKGVVLSIRCYTTDGVIEYLVAWGPERITWNDEKVLISVNPNILSNN